VDEWISDAAESKVVVCQTSDTYSLDVFNSVGINDQNRL